MVTDLGELNDVRFVAGYGDTPPVQLAGPRRALLKRTPPCGSAIATTYTSRGVAGVAFPERVHMARRNCPRAVAGDLGTYLDDLLVVNPLQLFERSKELGVKAQLEKRPVFSVRGGRADHFRIGATDIRKKCLGRIEFVKEAAHQAKHEGAAK